jgi:hypothetical protein
MAVVIHEILNSRTAMWPGVPPGVSVFIMFALLCFVGVLEGLQISVFAVAKMDLGKYGSGDDKDAGNAAAATATAADVEAASATNSGESSSETDATSAAKGETSLAMIKVSEETGYAITADDGFGEGVELTDHRHIQKAPHRADEPAVAKSPYLDAIRCCDLVFHGKNLERFVVGRQICVTVCMFVVARISSINADKFAEGYTSFGISSGFQEFANSGMLGALISTIIGSLMWRVIASKFPLVFMNNKLAILIIRMCLLAELTGIMKFSKAVAKGIIFVFRFKPDHEHTSIDMDIEPEPEEVEEVVAAVYDDDKKNAEAMQGPAGGAY